MKITTMISLKKVELRSANPKSRDRIRHRLNALLKVRQLRFEVRQAKKERAA